MEFSDGSSLAALQLLFFPAVSHVFNLIRHRRGEMIHAETQFHLSGMIFLFLRLLPDQLVALANVAGVVGMLPVMEH